MPAEERLRNKTLYKIELYLLKILPVIMALFCLVNTILSYCEIDLPILSYLGGVSILSLIFLYISSYTFRFCEYHRISLHYIVVTNTISAIDYNYNIPIDDRAMLSVYIILFGISIMSIIYLHVKVNKRSTTKNSE